MWPLSRRLRLVLAGLLVMVAYPSLADEASVRAWLDAWVDAQDGEVDAGPTQYSLGFHDLDGDGRDEALVLLSGRYWCGSGGCDALVLRPRESGYDILMQSSVTNAPIGLLGSSSHGWRDLFVHVGGGGIPSGAVAMRFDGTSYPQNPTVDGDPLPEGFKGKVLIADE